MALHQIRTDDVTGDPDAETFVITVNGKGVEIDLSDKSVAKLTAALAPYWKAGSESDYDVERRQRKTKTRPKYGADYDFPALKAWAQQNGVQLPKAGRMPRAIIDQYLQFVNDG
jgi:hypothetical protein